MSDTRDDTRDTMTAVLHGMTCVKKLLDTVSGNTPGQTLALECMVKLLEESRHYGLIFVRQRDQM